MSDRNPPAEVLTDTRWPIRPPGRPVGSHPLTPWAVRDMERFLYWYGKKYCNCSAACRAARMPRTAVDTLRRKIPWFKEEMDAIRQSYFDALEAKTLEEAQWDPKQRKFLLTSHPEGRRRGYGKAYEVRGQVVTGSWRDYMDAQRDRDN